MVRDIWAVIEDMQEEFEKICFSNKYWMPNTKSLATLQSVCLSSISNRAKRTAPEAMFLRWQELDKLVDDVVESATNTDDFVAAYMRKWE